jgi:putative ATPase
MLFDEIKPDLPNKFKPLPERVRPTDMGELFGQEHIWNTKSPLRRLVENDKFSSLIFWGPPGTGKTTLCRIIAAQLGRTVINLSAVEAGVKDIRAAIQDSQNSIDQGSPSHLMFMDEVHRLSKNQQDVLLPALELGVIKFIGATTENPSFEVNHAINSRSLVFKFSLLDLDALKRLLLRAIAIESPQQEVLPEVVDAIAENSIGDGRKALNLLEAILGSQLETQLETQLENSSTPITLKSLTELGHSLTINFDKKGDQHYDTASALIKSIRASHPDAAVYYLARMIDAGEDINFISRRLLIAASEDIGNANPTALLVATSGMQAALMIGLPEARITLSQVVTYLASSPKSDRSYIAVKEALLDVQKFGNLEIPLHIRNAPTKMMENIGYGKGYKNPHYFLEEAKKMEYLPAQLAHKNYYQPSEFGVERQIKQTLEKIKPRSTSR